MFVCMYYIGTKDQNQKFNIIIVVSRLHLLAFALCTLLFVIRFTLVLVPSLSHTLFARYDSYLVSVFFCYSFMDNFSFTLFRIPFFRFGFFQNLASALSQSCICMCSMKPKKREAKEQQQQQ